MKWSLRTRYDMYGSHQLGLNSLSSYVMALWLVLMKHRLSECMQVM